MYAAIMVRGLIGARKDAKRTMKMLRLNKQNHLVLLPENGSSRGMLDKVKEYITYGEISPETLGKLLGKWARLLGNKRVDADFLKENKFSKIELLANAVIENKAVLEELGIKPVFRLHAPSKGYERRGVKKPYKHGGALGFRGAEINKLIERMI